MTTPATLATLTDVLAPAFGPSWMDPAYLFAHFGTAFFWVSVAIVFVECGLLFPVLPGDSLLFAIGLFIASGQLTVPLWLAMVALVGAAFLGNVSGYEIGRAAGPALYRRDGRIIRAAYLEQTAEFFARHGARALVIGRFVPVVRTFVTVVAGIGRMPRRSYLLWSAVGAVSWAGLLTLLGYYLGRYRWFGEHLEVVVLAFSVISVAPAVWEWVAQRRTRAKHATAG